MKLKHLNEFEREMQALEEYVCGRLIDIDVGRQLEEAGMNIARQFGVTQKGGDPKLKQPLLRDSVSHVSQDKRDSRDKAGQSVSHDVPVSHRVPELEASVAALTKKVLALEAENLDLRMLIKRYQEQQRQATPIDADEERRMKDRERKAAYRARKRNAPC